MNEATNTATVSELTSEAIIKDYCQLLYLKILSA